MSTDSEVRQVLFGDQVPAVTPTEVVADDNSKHNQDLEAALLRMQEAYVEGNLLYLYSPQFIQDAAVLKMSLLDIPDTIGVNGGFQYIWPNIVNKLNKFLKK